MRFEGTFMAEYCSLLTLLAEEAPLDWVAEAEEEEELCCCSILVPVVADGSASMLYAAEG